MKALWQRLDRFWFGFGDPTALAVLRILMAWMVLWELAISLGDFDAWFTDKGFLPSSLISRFLFYRSDVIFAATELQVQLPFGPPRMGWLNGITDERITLAVYLGTMVAALFFMVGYHTRIAGLALALGLIAIHYRSILMIHSGDTLLRLIIIYLAFSRCGQAVSIDRLLRLRRSETSGVEPIPLWPQRLIAFQVALAYFATVWWKWQGVTWRDGTATWYPSVMDEFNRFPVPWFFERQPVIFLTTYGTLLVELALALLVWHTPWRKWVLISGLALHAYIEYRFNIPMFSWVITAAYVSYYTGEEVRGWFQSKAMLLARKRPWVIQLSVRTPKPVLESLNGLGWPVFLGGSSTPPTLRDG